MILFSFWFSKGMNRFLTVTKKEGLDMIEHTAFFTLTRNSRHQVDGLAQKCPLSNKERQELQPRLDRSQYSDGKSKAESYVHGFSCSCFEDSLNK